MDLSDQYNDAMRFSRLEIHGWRLATLSSVFFILGLKMLSKPETARRGNLIAAAGMSLAILTTILLHRFDGKPIGNIGWIALAIGAGSVIGWLLQKGLG
jgi:H+-translocating NAD(P) transhydrogenase subunit beta